MALLGVFFLSLAGALSLWNITTGHMALSRPKKSLFLRLPTLSLGVMLCIAGSLISLTLAFLRNDFSVNYVAAHSNRYLPLLYKLTAVWGGHEGSLLLWTFMLSVWTMLLSHYPLGLQARLQARMQMVLMGLILIFIWFLLYTSNPFLQQFQHIPSNGQDLNPLLQDIGMAFHPPILYMGYVGSALLFAFSIAVLIEGRYRAHWLEALWPWMMLSFCALTAGITFGSWWAYRELGWGGFWFWDPVENASFMPWLIWVALLHTGLVIRRLNIFWPWFLMLCLVNFTFSLLGTFLVRSGVLISVHAFANDPSRGLGLLMILAAAVIAALGLWIWRRGMFQHQALPHPASREHAIALANWLLMIMLFTVFTGVLFPLFAQLFNFQQYSVGPPFYNQLFPPLWILMMLVFIAALCLPWGNREYQLTKRTCFLGLTSAIAGIALGYFYGLSIGLSMGLILLIFGALLQIQFFWRLPKKSRYFPMFLAHLGWMMTVMGIGGVSSFALAKSEILYPGVPTRIGPYTITLGALSDSPGPNYTGIKIPFTITTPTGHVYQRAAYKRYYPLAKMPMTVIGLFTEFGSDIYIAPSEPRAGGFAMRLYYKPLVRWIWWGGGCILLAALYSAITMLERRLCEKNY